MHGPAVGPDYTALATLSGSGGRQACGTGVEREAQMARDHPTPPGYTQEAVSLLKESDTLPFALLFLNQIFSISKCLRH